MYRLVLILCLACGLSYSIDQAQARSKVITDAQNAYRNPEDVKKAPAAVRKACRDKFGLPNASDPTHWGSPEITECIRAGGPGKK